MCKLHLSRYLLAVAVVAQAKLPPVPSFPPLGPKVAQQKFSPLPSGGGARTKEILSQRLQRIMTKHSVQSTLQNSDAPVGLSLGVSLPEAVNAASANPSDSVISIGGGFRKKGTPEQDALCVFHSPDPTFWRLSPHIDDACVTPTDKFAMGSTAKMYTAAAVLRLVEQGKFGLDDKAVPLFDDLWTRLNGTSITNGLGPLINEVTVRQLLGMQSGIPDFDLDASRQYQFDHPHEDLGPVKEMDFLFPMANFSCHPGTCVEYSSSNYELLGLLLAQQSGKQSWDEYTQAEDLPIGELGMTGTSFALHGTCSEYTQVHAYSDERNPEVDVFDVSCTNGWTCGNLISTAADAATFVKALLGGGERLLKEDTKQEMLKFKPLTKSWALGLPYGLGLMDLGVPLGVKPGEVVGHGGSTYGFSAFTVYSKTYDFGISVVANSENSTITAGAMADAFAEVASFVNASKTHTVMV